MPRSPEKKEVIKLPTVRFQRDLSGEGLLQALQDCGFAYLVDLEPEFGQAFATLLEASKDFFHQLTKEDRKVLARGQWRAANAGYVGVGVEALAPESGNHDPKEAFNVVYGDRYEPLETLLPVSLRTAKNTFDQLVLGRLVPLLVDRLGEALERHGWGPTAAAFREAHVLAWPQRPSQRILPYSLDILQHSACSQASYLVKGNGKLGPEHMEAVDSNEFALCGDLNSSREQQRACSNRPSLRANLSQMSEGSCTFLQESARSGSMCEENEAPCPSSPRPREQHATVTRSLGSVSTNDGKCACDDIDSSRYNQSRGPAELATTLRLLHYPSIPLGTVFNHEREGNDAAIEPVVLAGAHSDYGTFTLLYQDHVGGLELQIGERWVCIEREPTDPFGLLLNIGDVLWLWTRGRISSTVHRVVARARNDALERDDSLHLDGCPDRRVFSEERFSVALFVHPLDDTVVDVVNGRRAVDVLNERLGRTYRNPGPCNG